MALRDGRAVAQGGECSGSCRSAHAARTWCGRGSEQESKPEHGGEVGVAAVWRGIHPQRQLHGDFEGVDQAGRRVTLNDLVKDTAIVLYFYPKDFTPVCTAQACLFRDTNAELAAEGVTVVGVSAADRYAHTGTCRRTH